MSMRSLTIRGAAAALMLAAGRVRRTALGAQPIARPIALRWYSDNTPAAAAVQLAQLHCRSWGKSAELTADAKDGSDEVAHFRCR